MTSHPRPSSPRLLALLGTLTLGTATLSLASCTDDPAASDTPFAALPDEQEPVAATFTLVVDPSHEALQTPRREPQAGPVTVAGESDVLEIVAHAKTMSLRPDVLWVDVYIVNRGGVGIDGLALTLEGASVYDLTREPLSSTPVTELTAGGVGPEGVAHVSLGVPVGDGGPVELSLGLSGTTTTRRVTSSAPLALSPDGDELWVVQPEASTVAVIDTATDRRVEALAVEGSPRSLAITADGELVLVASATGNTVTVIERATRRVLQTLGEADGIAREPRHLVVSGDGTHAYLSAYVGDRVTVLERLASDRFRVAGEVEVGRRPTGMSLSADGKTLFVSHFLPRGKLDDNETWVSVIDTESRTLREEVVLRDEFNLEEVQCLADVFGETREDMVFEGVSTQQWGVFLEPNGNIGWMPMLKFGPIPVWEIPPDLEIEGINPTLFAPSFVGFLDTHAGDVAPKRHPGLVDPPDVNPDYVACAHVPFEIEMPTRQLVEGSPTEQLNTGAATPSGNNALTESGQARFVGWSRGGRRALVLSYIADEIVVYDAISKHPASQHHLTLSGSNPTGIVVTPDGSKAYVSYANSMFVSVLGMGEYADPHALPAASYVPYEYRDLPGIAAQAVLTRTPLVRDIAAVPDQPPLEELGQITIVDQDPLDASRRRGKILFDSSSPEKYPQLSRSRQGSCASCHPDGGHDGLGWGTMEGERRTLSLYGGVGGRGWLHQSGTHRDALEFVQTVVPERLGGNPSDEEYRELADYLAWGIDPLQPPATDAELVARGEQIFAASCATCHAGERYTSGSPDPDDPFGGGLEAGPVLYDVGTREDDMRLILPRFFAQLFPSPINTLYADLRGDRDLGAEDPVQTTLGFRPRPERAAGHIKATSLVGAWDYVLFFHDGRYDDIRDAVTHLDGELGLGLGEEDVDAVVEYLKTL